MALRLYSALIHAARVLAWPVLWWLGRRVPAYRERWDERRGRAPLPPELRGGVLIHAASMGEWQAALPLVRALRQARPALPLLLTCSSPTASARIAAELARFTQLTQSAPSEPSAPCAQAAALVHHVYLPFDTPGAVRRLLDAADPRLLVVVETELWPQLLTQAQARGCAVVLASGRLSAASARRYARFRRTTHTILAALDALLVQDEAARDRFLALGAAPARLTVSGNLKFDTPLPADHDERVAALRAVLGDRPLWLAASTHEGEEALLLQAAQRLREAAPGLLLVLVPRHPQRFDAVAALVDASGLRWQRRSAAQPVAAATELLLVDAMGELTAWMALAPTVFMGGTLVAVGGHNPLEAMQFGCALLAGPQRYNFAAAFAALQAADAVCPVADAAQIAAQVAEFHHQPALARAAGARGRTLFEAAGGATGRSLQALLALLERRGARVLSADACTWADPALLPIPEAASFDPATGSPVASLAAEAAVPGSGRGTVWWQQAGAQTLLLRHYRRGGLLGRLVADRYLRGPRSQSRALAEFALLQRMRGWGLAVPRPAAARWQAAGPLHYRADILLERIAGAQDLAITLQQRPLGGAEWQTVGAAIAALHAHGVDHADLNCHNLMHDARDASGRGPVWIVDFDRGAVRAPGPWQDANLQRLRRSLRKESRRMARWHWAEADWDALCAGYAGATTTSPAGR